KPNLASPARTMITPTRIASREANAIARAGSPPATSSGVTVAAIIGPRAESGPSTSTRDGPNTAYPSKHKIDVYSPGTGGRPASCGEAMACGTRNADSTSPATTSFANQGRCYERTIAQPGTKDRKRAPRPASSGSAPITTDQPFIQRPERARPSYDRAP